jgi:hypothetical protein
MASAALNRAGEKRRDDVFYLILVDFLVQILFFGLFLFVFYQASITKDQDKLKEAVDAAGVSDITELTDDLSRLAPLQLKQLDELIKQAGGAEAVTELLKRTSQEGGARTSIARLDKLRKLEGRDKPSCLFDPSRQPEPLMTVLASGRNITVVEGSAELQRVSGGLGGQASIGRSYSPESFVHAFSPLLRSQPQCRYFVKFQERTELVAPRRAVGSIFYLMVR